MTKDKPTVALLDSRIDAIRKELDTLKSELNKNSIKTNEILLSIAIMEKTLESISMTQRERKVTHERIVLFVVGGFIAAVVSFIVRGGLNI